MRVGGEAKYRHMTPWWLNFGWFDEWAPNRSAAGSVPLRLNPELFPQGQRLRQRNRRFPPRLLGHGNVRPATASGRAGPGDPGSLALCDSARRCTAGLMRHFIAGVPARITQTLSQARRASPGVRRFPSVTREKPPLPPGARCEARVLPAAQSRSCASPSLFPSQRESPPCPAVCGAEPRPRPIPAPGGTPSDPGGFWTDSTKPSRRRGSEFRTSPHASFRPPQLLDFPPRMFWKTLTPKWPSASLNGWDKTWGCYLFIKL